MVLAIVLLLIASFACGCAPAADAQLLSQWTLHASPDRALVIQLPRHVDAEVQPRTVYALETTVDVPAAWAGRSLALTIPFLPALVELDVDGHRIDALETETRAAYRRSGPHVFEVPPELVRDGTLHLSLLVHHAWSASAWVDTVPRLTPADQPDSAASWLRTINGTVALFSFGGLLQVSLMYLAIFAFDRQRIAYLWFAIQGLSASYYDLWVQGCTQHWFGTTDTSGVGALLALAPIASVYFTHALLQLGRPSRLWLLLLGLAVASSLVLSDPFQIPLRMAITVFCVAVTMIYQVVVCVRLLRSKNPPMGTKFVLFAWLVLAAVAWPDLAFWLGLGELAGGARLACAGLAVFSLTQSLLLARQHFGSLREADRLTSQLRERIDLLERHEAEMKVLNEELQRQIGDRSRQLFAALSLVSGRAQARTSLAPGHVVQKRYEVVRKIGAGGMGTVYEVKRLADGQRFALKMARSLDGVELARTAREAQIAATASHPHIVTIFDVDVADEGYLFLVLEYVDGTELGELRPRFADARFACEVLAQVAEGLAALHARDIVHRDLKPTNVLVRLDANKPFAKLADFGISRNLVEDPTDGSRVSLSVAPPPPGNPDDEETNLVSTDARAATRRTPSSTSSLTQAGQVIGTPFYIAPELALGQSALGPAVDAFSFGTMAFDLLVGQKPYEEPPLMLRLEGRPLPEPPSLAEARADLPRAVSDAIQRCLDPDPGRRPTAAQLAETLRASLA